MYIETKLENNIKVLLIPVRDSKIITIKLIFKIGSDNENKNTLELAHFVEHMFAQYTSSKYPNYSKLISNIKKLGIYRNASVDYSITDYYMKGQSIHFDFMLDVLYNTYVNFKLDTKHLEQERNSVIEERNTILNNSWTNLTTDINKNLYPGHIRELSQRENIKNVKRLDGKDIINFYNKYYNNQNLVIAIGGDFTPAKTIKKLNQTFGKCNRNGLVTKFTHITNSNVNSINKPIISFVKNDNTTSSKLNIIFKIPYTYFDNEKYLIYSISSILSNGMSSRLYNRLRNNAGLVYSIKSNVQLSNTSKTLNNFCLDTEVADNKLLSVIDIIIDELQKIKEGEITNDELIKHQNETKTFKLVEKQNKNPNNLLKKYSTYMLWNKKIITDKDEHQMFMDITKKDIKNIANKIFDMSNVMIMYSGKTNKNKDIKNILKKYNIKI